ncbi:MAG: hypothetical protein AMXMBFR13_20960 [Phycisphaerae bacterium]
MGPTSFISGILLLCGALPGQSPRQVDILVYGGTASGAMAAIAARQQNASVLLLEPGRHIGGMVSGGLGKTDMARQEQVIGGMARQFFERVGKHYGQDIAWTFEPHVAEATFNDWLKEAGVEVVFEQPLVSVEKNESSITRLKTAGGEVAARIFVDCSYEGDLMKAAGVSYVVGREGRDKYGESLAGRREIMPGHHQAIAAVPAYGQDGKLLPYVVRQSDLAPVGAGDGRFQTYGFRLCLTDDPANRIPIPRPANYDAARFGLVRNYLRSAENRLSLRHFMCLSHMPNNKTDINSCGFVSTAPLGAAWEYPEADTQRRREIWNEHLEWAHGLVYFLQNDPSVPESIRQEMAPWGLARDEFVDTGHWPHQLYIREGRRMLGEYILTQHDLQKHRSKYDSIGMGGYNIDIREVQWVACEISRFPVVKEEVLQEGYLSYPVEPYEIPFRCLLPRQEECDNLLVPVCASMSTVAYASFRMEPQYMIAGQSSGVAAALAIHQDSTIHRVDLNRLQRVLRGQGQILSARDIRAGGSGEAR